mmetsp:Transcript_12779/g.25924  ORF Transcript_12779/g.25924 Transcript_12779/m.25924 type:complete len:128 (+) Transcript_12779:1075-1458(+)
MDPPRFHLARHTPWNSLLVENCAPNDRRISCLGEDHSDKVNDLFGANASGWFSSFLHNLVERPGHIYRPHLPSPRTLLSLRGHEKNLSSAAQKDARWIQISVVAAVYSSASGLKAHNPKAPATNLFK